MEYRFGKKSVNIDRGVETLKVEILELDKKSRTVTYKVSNSPICQYDQHSRARIGAKFFDYKVSDKPHYIFYTAVYDKLESPVFCAKVTKTLTELEDLRKKTKFKTTYNLMTRACEYKVTQTFDSLKGQMMRRLAFCEEEFIVGLHWKLRQLVIDEGVEEAEKWLPGCDIAGKCYYAKSDYLSNMFGVLFAGCGRWPDESKYATFNESCTIPDTIEEQMNLSIPQSEHEIKIVKESIEKGC